jgi:HSP20 family protein
MSSQADPRTQDPRSSSQDPRSQDPRSQSDQKLLSRTGEPQRRDSSLSSSPRSGYLQRRGDSPFGFGGGFGGLDPFRGNPFSFMRRMTEEMDRLFQDVGQGWEGGREARQGREAMGWSPAIEVTQREGKLLVQCELPGISPNDVKLEITNDALILQGERRLEREENERGIQRSERQYGAFYRSIPLPEGADIEHANARCQNGLLEVTIPIPQQREQRRSIPIETQPTGTQTGGETRRQAA